ncbi:MAG: hypothetical protein ACTS8S_23540 [Giesbergeria sp.]
MSTRTVIEINHDYLRHLGPQQWADLMTALASSSVTGQLNRAEGKPVNWTTGLRILGQRHHSDALNLKVE